MHTRLALLLCLSMATAIHGSTGGPTPESPTPRLAPPPPPIEVGFPAGKTVVEVPFRLTANKIIVPVRVNGHGPYDFVLDTGASGGLLDVPGAAATLGLTPFGQARVAGAGGGEAAMLEMVRGVDFEVGGLTLRGGRLAIPPTDHPPLMPGAGWQGVFGRQVFSNLVVTIDWQEKRLLFHDPDRFQPPAGAVSVPLRKRRGHVFVAAELTMADGAPRTVELVVDTGANQALALTPSAGTPPPKRIDDTVLGHGVSGTVTGSLGRISRLRFAGTNLENVLTAFPDATQSGVIGSGSDGNLGAEILRRFRTTFDYARDRMLVEPTDALGAPFATTTAGLYLRPWPDPEGRAVIGDVFEASPAAAVGLTTEDRIVALDGESVPELGIEAVRRRLEGGPGTRVTLTVERDGTRRTVALTLQKLL